MNLGPLKTSVSRKTICFEDSSSVKFIVVRKEFVKSLKLLISVSGRVHTGNMKKLYVVVVYQSKP